MATVVRTPGQRAELKRVIKELEEKEAQAGWFATSKYPDGTPVAYIASIMEYGHPAGNIPARSFVRVTAAEQKAHWAVLMGKGAKAAMSGRLTVDQVYDALGLGAAGDIRKTISNIVTPELKAATLAARAKRRRVKVSEITGAAAKPLNDTGVLVATLTNQTTLRSD